MTALNKLTDGQLLFRLQDVYGAEQDAIKINDHEYAQECSDIVSVIREVMESRKALEAAEKRNTELNQRNTELTAKIEPMDRCIAELEARDEPKFVKCWSCKHDIEVLAIVDCDGYCPRCAAPIDLDDEPCAGIGVKGE